MYTVIFFLQTTLFSVLYGIIGYVARKQAQRIVTETACEEALPNGERKILKTMMMILGVFYLCWAPYMIGCMFMYVLGYHRSWLVTFVQIASCLVTSNSIMNPIIYACRDRTFRKAFKSLLRVKRNTGSLEWFTWIPIRRRYSNFRATRQHFIPITVLPGKPSISLASVPQSTEVIQSWRFR